MAYYIKLPLLFVADFKLSAILQSDWCCACVVWRYCYDGSRIFSQHVSTHRSNLQQKQSFTFSDEFLICRETKLYPTA